MDKYDLANIGTDPTVAHCALRKWRDFTCFYESLPTLLTHAAD